MQVLRASITRFTETEANHLVTHLSRDPEDDWTYRGEKIPCATGERNHRVRVHDEAGLFLGYL